MQINYIDICESELSNLLNTSALIEVRLSFNISDFESNADLHSFVVLRASTKSNKCVI
jgi:hypothetical protein